MDERARGARAPAWRWIAFAGAGGLLATAVALLLRAELPGETSSAGASRPGAHVFEREGLRIAFRLEALDGGAPRAWSPASARISIRDAGSGAPVRGLTPLAWMWRDEGGAPPDEGACRA